MFAPPIINKTKGAGVKSNRGVRNDEIIRGTAARMAELSLRSDALPAPAARTSRWSGNCSIQSLHQDATSGRHNSAQLGH